MGRKAHTFLPQYIAATPNLLTGLCPHTLYHAVHLFDPGLCEKPPQNCLYRRAGTKSYLGRSLRVPLRNSSLLAGFEI